jgi:hypothetical protein
MPSTGLKRLQDDRPLLTYYQKFESIVALITYSDYRADHRGGALPTHLCGSLRSDSGRA